jgi:predicted phosphodiesterase
MTTRSKRILVLSDIHGNLPALQSVLQDAGEVDAVWCLGDLVGYGPYPNECIELIREQKELLCVMGNHDAGMLGRISLSMFNHDAQVSLKWVKTVISEACWEFLRSLPDQEKADKTTLVHGSPRNSIWEYVLDPGIARDNFDSFDTPLSMVGHTHLPIAYIYFEDLKEVEWTLGKKDKPMKLEHRAILNPGSVGQPRDHDPRAAYAIFYPRRMTWEFHRVEYDVEMVQDAINKAGLPAKHASRLTEGW